MTRFVLPVTVDIGLPTLRDGGVETNCGIGLDSKETLGFDRSLPFRIGQYRALSILGRGGMGVVYLAERSELALQQTVALKVLPIWAEAADHARFLQERQILAGMEHPHIARLLDGGVSEEGAPYFVMELVQGVALTQYVQQQALSQLDRLGLFLKVCDAVHYAHQRLVVHRDLKPDNILVEADREPKLLDFGIAKVVDVKFAIETATGAMTPAYAAPEQLLGQPISTLTDVFSLGAILYELLTNVRPRVGANVIELVRALDQPVVRPSCVVRSHSADQKRLLLSPVHDDLDLIVMTALQREPTRRYASVEALAKDLRAYLSNRPISARPDSRLYRFRKLIQRNQFASAAVAFGFFALISALGVSVFMAKNANAQAKKAAAVKNFMLNVFAASDPDAAHAANVSVRELLDTSAEQLHGDAGSHANLWQGEPEVRAEIQSGIAAAYANLGEFTRALSLLDEVSDFPSASAMLTRARALRGLGDLAAARSAAIDGLNRPDAGALRVQLQSELAGISTDYGDFVSAETGLRYALAQTSLASDIAARTPLNLALAELLNKTERTAQAQVVLDQTLKTLLANTVSPNTLVARVEFLRGDVFETLGDRVQAERSYLAARTAFETLLGPANPRTLAVRDAYSFFLLRGGNTEAAERELKQAITDGVRVYGENHYAVAALQTSLSTIFVRRGQLEPALSLALTALNTRKQSFAANSAPVLESRNIVTTILMRQKRLPEASEWVQGTILAINTLAPSLRDRRLSSVETRAAEILTVQNKFADALAILERISAREDRKDSNFDLQPTLLSITQCALKIGNLARARSAAERSIAISGSPRGIAAHRWASLLALGQVQRAEHNPNSADTLQKALVAAKELGANNPSTKRVEEAMREPLE